MQNDTAVRHNDTAVGQKEPKGLVLNAFFNQPNDNYSISKERIKMLRILYDWAFLINDGVYSLPKIITALRYTDVRENEYLLDSD